MAAFINETERDEFIDLYFGNSEDENEFEGFGVDDINDNFEAVSKIDFDQSLKDVEIAEGVSNGWEQIDKPPSCVQFTGHPGLNVKVGKIPQPIDFNVLFKSLIWNLLVEQTKYKYMQTMVSKMKN